MLKTPEAAELLDVSEATLKRWRRRTLREGRQIGPKWKKVPLKGLVDVVVYDEADIEKWIKDRMVAA